MKNKTITLQARLTKRASDIVAGAADAEGVRVSEFIRRAVAARVIDRIDRMLAAKLAQR